MNLLDGIGIIIFLLFSFLIYKRYWFYSLYSFLRFLLFSILSLGTGLFLSSNNPVSFFLSKMQVALLITGILFFLLWKFISFKKIFFTLDTHLFKIDRFVYFHKLNKIINVPPSIIASGFFLFFLFSIAVSLTPKSAIIENQVDGSGILKPIMYSLYFSPISIGGIRPFEGTLFKLPSAISIKGKEILDEIRRPEILASIDRINVEREKAGLPPVSEYPQDPTYPQNPSQDIPQDNTPAQSSYPSQPQNPQIPQNPNPANPTTPPSNPQNPNPTTPPISNPTDAPIPTPSPTSIPTQSPKDTRSIEQELFELTNQKRSENGVAPLAWNEDIAAVARSHSNDMNERNYFSHNSPEGVTPGQRLSAGGISYSIAGENIAGAGSAQQIMTAWMNSPGHRANILSPSYGRIGIGVSENSRYGLLATQNFTN